MAASPMGPVEPRPRHINRIRACRPTRRSATSSSPRCAASSRGTCCPVASDLEHADEYPEDLVATMRELGLFGVTIPEEYGGLGLDLLTYIGVIEELAAGWMSLSGILNTHVMAANLLKMQGTDGAEGSAGCRAWRRGRSAAASRCPSPTPGPTRARHVPRGARRRRVRDHRHEDVGHERRAGGPRRARGAHRRGHHVLHGREGARAERFGGDHA